MKFKVDVLIGTSHALCEILAAISTFEQEFSQVLVITSVSDGKHMKGSRHYKFEAADVGTHNLRPELQPEKGPTVVNALQGLLGPRFSVFFEDIGTPNEHIHIQVRKGTTYHAPTG